MDLETQKQAIYLKLNQASVAQLVDNLAHAAIEIAELKKQLAAALAPKKPK
jgi:hypothetical protein